MPDRDAKDDGPDAVRERIRAAAERALAEAEERRLQAAEAQPPREIDGRGGKEPVRYGDWEVRGLASDF
jgi:hypothetical protein